MVALLFIFGLAVGSFINAAVYRMSPVRGNAFLADKAALSRDPSNGVKSIGSLLWDRSRCPKCKTQLKWWHLFPLLSFFFLRGRCYYCQEKISWQYPLVELFTSLSFTGFYWFNSSLSSFWLTLVLGLLIISLLIFIALYDYKNLLILNVSVVAGILLSFWLRYYSTGLVVYIISGFGLSLLFAGLYYWSRKTWLGFGDVKLGLFIGLLGGPLTLVVVFLASSLGSVIGVILMLLKSATLRTKLPFGTFLAISAIVAFIFQDYITYYLGQFLFY